MPGGLKNRYFCTNVSGCSYAQGDVPFSEDFFKRHMGVCRGPNNDGCGEILRRGDPLDTRGKWLAIGIAAFLGFTGVGWIVQRTFFPQPIEHVAFVAHESRTQDAAALLGIEVTRELGVADRAVIQFESIDGTAKAGQDYESIQGRLTFEPGERKKTLAITIFPDSTFQKTERHFTVVLTNVAGLPRHVVFIDQRKVDLTLKTQAEQVVRAASVIAKDIADNIVKQRVITDLLSASRQEAASFRMYQEELQIAQGNLGRARESYAQFFRDMHAMQPRTILQAMDSIGSNLDHQGFKQQAQATIIMKRQFEEYLSRKAMNMDQWAIELSTVVPRMTTGKPGNST